MEALDGNPAPAGGRDNDSVIVADGRSRHPPGRGLAPRVRAAAVVPRRRLTRAIAAALMCMVGVWLPAVATAQGGPATLDGSYSYSWTRAADSCFR